MPEKFQTLDKNKRLYVSSDDLMTYADFIYTYCHDLFQLFFKIANRALFDDEETYGDTNLIKSVMDIEIAQLISQLNTK